MHCVVQSILLEIVTLLINKEVNVDIQNKFGKTPLMKVINGYIGDDTIIKLLLQHGASKELENNHGISSKKFAKIKGIEL